MELLKKKIRQALTTGTTVNSSGKTITVIIPDPDAIYNFMFSMDQELHEFGFFDAYVEPVVVTEDSLPDPPPPQSEPATNTGTVNIIPEKLFSVIDNNTIVFDGNNTILEYGVLYTSDINYGTAQTLVYENLSSVEIRTGGIVTPVYTGHVWNAKIVPVADATLYYRSFVRNALGIGYGLVKSEYIPLVIGGIIT